MAMNMIENLFIYKTRHLKLNVKLPKYHLKRSVSKREIDFFINKNYIGSLFQYLLLNNTGRVEPR